MQHPSGNPPGFLVIQIKIGDTITIGNTVLHFSDRRGNLLRVAVKAPKDQKITRNAAKQESKPIG